MDNRQVIERFVRYWIVQDVENAVTCLSEDCVYALKISETALPFAGEQVGRDAIRNAFYAILRDWDYLEWCPSILSVDGSEGRLHVKYAYRFRRTGDILSGTFRVTCTIEKGMITRIIELHDAARVEAFMRMVSAKPSEPLPFTGSSNLASAAPEFLQETSDNEKQ